MLPLISVQHNCYIFFWNLFKHNSLSVRLRLVIRIVYVIRTLRQIADVDRVLAVIVSISKLRTDIRTVRWLWLKLSEREKNNSVFLRSEGKMFGNAIAKLPHTYGLLRVLCPAAVTTRRDFRTRGKPPLEAKTLEQRLQCKPLFEVMFSLYLFISLDSLEIQPELYLNVNETTFEFMTFNFIMKINWLFSRGSRKTKEIWRWKESNRHWFSGRSFKPLARNKIENRVSTKSKEKYRNWKTVAASQM